MKNENAGGPNLILSGFMGTGKTTVGRLVARRLNMPFIDTDILVETAAGQSIAQVIETSGEEFFRELEAQVCRQVAQRSGQVIATGGGALLDDASRQALEASGIIICLTCELEEIIQRIGDGTARPLYHGDRDRPERLYTERENHYQSLRLKIDTTDRTPDQVTEEIIDLWQNQA